MRKTILMAQNNLGPDNTFITFNCFRAVVKNKSLFEYTWQKSYNGKRKLF